MSLTAAAIRLMADRGLSALDIAEIAEACEPKRNSNAERQARFRERKRNESNVTGNALPPPIEDNHTPPPSSQPSVSKKERARELPDDWQPLPFGIGTVCGKIIDGWPPGELDRQLEHFRAHHGKKGDKFKDWQKAWATWVLNSEKFGHGRQQQAGGVQRNGPPAINHLAREALEWGLAEDGFGDGGPDFHDALPAPRRIGREDHAGGIRGGP